MSAPDWDAIKTEYITTDISQRKLAKKCGVSYGTLRGRCEREGWVAMKEEHQRKVIANVTQELEKKQIKNLVKEVEATDVATELVLKFLNGQKEDNRASSIDTKRLNEAVSALSKCAAIKKLALEVTKVTEDSNEIKIIFDKDIEELSG